MMEDAEHADAAGNSPPQRKGGRGGEIRRGRPAEQARMTGREDPNASQPERDHRRFAAPRRIVALCLCACSAFSAISALIVVSVSSVPPWWRVRAFAVSKAQPQAD